MLEALEEGRAGAPCHPSLLSSPKLQKPWRRGNTRATELTALACAGPGLALPGGLFYRFLQEGSRIP